MIWWFGQLEAKKSNGRRSGLCDRLDGIYPNIDNLDPTRHGPQFLILRSISEAKYAKFSRIFGKIVIRVILDHENWIFSQFVKLQNLPWRWQCNHWDDSIWMHQLYFRIFWLFHKQWIWRLKWSPEKDQFFQNLLLIPWI